MPPEVQYEIYFNIIGTTPKHIYEIGSGKGELISYLASLGHICRATEVSKERGEKHVPENLNITWSNSDGIHLDKFENENTYDFVISNAVIEHMHPKDIKPHFDGVLKILKPGGKYIFFTIHKFYGPIDISRVFGMKKPMGMHLKEYMIHELVAELRKAGFSKISFPDRVFTKKFYKYTPFSKNELGWVKFLEKIIDLLPYSFRNRLLAFERNIFPIGLFYIVAEKD
jgi:SAM-dependent methyltransferase